MFDSVDGALLLFFPQSQSRSQFVLSLVDVVLLNVVVVAEGQADIGSVVGQSNDQSAH